MKKIQNIALIAAFGLAISSSHAESIKLKAALTGADEVPAKQVSGTGTLTATLDTDTNTLKYHVEYAGLTGAVSAAHFHGPAVPGTNAKSQVPVKAPFDSPIEGTATITAEQVKDLLDGKWYFNLHTGANPGGELRGQVVKDQ
ncbi:MAG: CHRD domain-containing protein [Terriglobus sp.]